LIFELNIVALVVLYVLFTSFFLITDVPAYLGTANVGLVDSEAGKAGKEIAGFEIIEALFLAFLAFFGVVLGALIMFLAS